MWESLTQSWRGTSKQGRSATQVEEDIRRQLAELERQTVAFHEAIGLLRATLSVASDQEREGRMRLQQVTELAMSSSCEADQSLALAQEVATEGWRHDRLYAHTLRLLYHRLLEAKSRFLYQWHEHLMTQVQWLPEQRQDPVTSLLENSLQGILAVGVGQVEEQYRVELEDMLEATSSPFANETDPQGREASLSLIASLIDSLSQQTPAPSASGISDETTEHTEETDAT